MKLRCVGTVAVVVLTGWMLPAGAAAQIDQNAGTMSGQQMSGDVERAPGTTSATNPRAANQPASMRDSLGAPGQNGQQILDKQFVRSAAEGSLAEVKIGTLATEKGTADVKDLAKKMVDDHTSLNSDLASVADSLGVMLPKKLNREDQAEYDKLNGLSGKEFDTEYVTYAAKSHWQDAHNYRMEASIAVDPDLQSEVIKALGVMREHIGLIVKTATAEGIAMPERPRRPRPATSASNTGH
jgi:putative membrane protein